MVFGHIISSVGPSESYLSYRILDCLLFFFMPWFFYKSGSFYRPKSVKDIIEDSIRRFILPFFIFSVLGHIVYCVIQLCLSGNISFQDCLIEPLKQLLALGSLYGNSPLWFLVTLPLVKLLFSLCGSSKKLMIVLVICCATLSIIVSDAKEIVNHESYVYRLLVYPRWFYNTLSGTFFYGIGALMKDVRSNVPCFCVSFLLFVILSFACLSRVDMFPNDLKKGSYCIWLISSLCGIVSVKFIFDFWNKRVYSMHFLSMIGKNAMTILVTHMILINIVTCLFSFWGYTDKVIILCNILILSIISPLTIIYIDRRMPWIVGKIV